MAVSSEQLSRAIPFQGLCARLIRDSTTPFPLTIPMLEGAHSFTTSSKANQSYVSRRPPRGSRSALNNLYRTFSKLDNCSIHVRPESYDAWTERTIVCRTSSYGILVLLSSLLLQSRPRYQPTVLSGCLGVNLPTRIIY